VRSTCYTAPCLRFVIRTYHHQIRPCLDCYKSRGRSRRRRHLLGGGCTHGQLRPIAVTLSSNSCQRLRLDFFTLHGRRATLPPANEGECRRIMSQVWKADSEAVLETLRSSPLRESRSEQFHSLFGYLLGNREGIDNWWLVPSKLRRCIGRKTLASKYSKPLLSTTLFRSISAPPLRSAWCQFRGGRSRSASHSRGDNADRETKYERSGAGNKRVGAGQKNIFSRGTAGNRVVNSAFKSTCAVIF
jgi:hypothetical protein